MKVYHPADFGTINVTEIAAVLICIHTRTFPAPPSLGIFLLTKVILVAPYLTSMRVVTQGPVHFFKHRMEVSCLSTET